MDYSLFVCKTNNIVLLFIGIYLILFIHTTKAHEFLAVQMFGDSILDTGNNNGIKNTIVRSNFYPYGKKFDGRRATGRFSDGRLISDFIAEAIGIKRILPPYHEKNLSSKDLQTGLCFASAGSGYDPFTSELLQVYNLQEQLEFFNDYKQKLRQDVGEETMRKIIEGSLYVISGANNDIVVSYYASHLRKFQFDIESYTDLLVSKASIFFTDLYKSGARKVAVFGVAPLGCTPFTRTIAGGFNRGCAENMNEGARIYNAKLSATVASLKDTLPGFNIIVIDIYNPVNDLMQNPTKYGFHVVDRGCCSLGTSLETGLLCNRFIPTCKNSSDYMFWDSVHPSEVAYKALTPLLVKQFVF